MKTNKKDIAIWLINIIVPLCILLIPTTETFTTGIRTFFVITLMAILMFAFGKLPNAIPALLLPFMYTAFGVADMSAALSTWTSPILWMVVAGLLLSGILNRIGLLQRISYGIIVLVGGTYRGYIFAMLIVGAIFNLISPSPMVGLILIMMSIGVCKIFGIEKSKASAGIMLAPLVGLSASTLFIYSPSGVGVTVLSAGDAAADMVMSYGSFFVQNIAAIPLYFLLGLVICFLFKPDKALEGKAHFKQKLAELGKIKPEEIKTAVVVCLFVIFLFTANFHGIPLQIGFIVAAAILFFPGMNVATQEDLKDVNIGLLLFIGGCMSIGAVANVVGAGQFLADLIVPFIEGTPSGVFIWLVFLFGFIINFLLTPAAATASLSAPLISIAVSMGVQPLPVVYAFMIGLDNIILPYESGLHAATYSFGLMDIKDFMKFFFAKFVVTAIYLAVILIPYWKLLGMF